MIPLRGRRQGALVLFFFQGFHFLFHHAEEFRGADGKGIADKKEGVGRGAVGLLFDIQQVKALEGGKIRQRGLGQATLEPQFLNGFCKGIGKIGVRFHGKYIR